MESLLTMIFFLEDDMLCDNCSDLTKVEKIVGCINGHIICETCLKKVIKACVMETEKVCFYFFTIIQ